MPTFPAHSMERLETEGAKHILQFARVGKSRSVLVQEAVRRLNEGCEELPGPGLLSRGPATEDGAMQVSCQGNACGPSLVLTV